jgi:ABC-type multidrug transport system fused ATPase/permease subunit
MKLQSRSIIAVVLTGSWINASEFFRNEVLLKTYWVAHYQSLGMTFPSEPQNGMIWVAWGFLFAIAIYIISRKFNLVQTTLISWFTAFVLMWVVTWNLHVLPSAILVYAVPLSLLEAFVGSCICRKMSPKNAMESNS